MKKMFLLLITFSIGYLFIRGIFSFFGKGYEVNYIITTKNFDFEIKEKYIKNTKNETDNYLITINTDSNIYSYQIFEKLNEKEIIEEIKYFKNEDIECILPIFKKEKILFDITCNQNNNIIYYHNMDKNSKVDDFAHSIELYKKEQFIDTSKSQIKDSLFTLNEENIVNNHLLAINDYRGLLIVGEKYKDKIKNINIFNTDQYLKNLSAFTENYYIVADYSQSYEFDKFYVINIKKGTIKELKDYYKISFDSYIQGIIDDSIYIFDKDNKSQYEIDCKTMNITKIGSIDTGIKYYENGTWSRIELKKAIDKELLFKINNYREILEDGTVIDTIGNKKSGYIYTYVKNNNGRYSLYLSNVVTPQIKNYLFEIDNLDSVLYIDNYIYFKDGNSIKYYNETTGLKILITSEELLFNNHIKYNVIN